MPGEKQHDPTPHRRQKAREEGRVSKSQDLAAALLLLLGLMLLASLGAGLVEFLGRLTKRQFSVGGMIQPNIASALAEWKLIVTELARVMLPILGLLLVGAILVHVLQTGLLLTPSRIMPDLNRLNPLKGLANIFSIQNFFKLLINIFKIIFIASVAGLSLYADHEGILKMADMSLESSAIFLLDLLFWTTIKISVALLILALADYAFQRWKNEQDLKMTTQELHDEMKNLEGDPHVRAQRKAVQRQLAMDRLESAVPKADVVVTNPTELAIAIQYDPDTMHAPKVIAKGAGIIAGRIRQLALESGIPVLERKPLAQALYREVEVNQEIPEDKYAAVAELLAYVYQLQGKEIPNPPSAAA